MGIGDLPTAEDVLAQYDAVFRDVERHTESGQFEYLATIVGPRLTVGVEVCGTHSKLSSVTSSLRFSSAEMGNDLGTLMVNGILGDRGPYNRGSNREYVGQIWHALWLGSLAATFLKDVLD